MSLKKIISIASLTLVTQTAFAGAVDLTGWGEDANIASSGTWTVQPGNDAVKQTTNGNPTVFYKAGSNDQGNALSGSIKVETTSDDDFIGFVLGYDTGEISGTNTDFWLIDWKQGNQSAFSASASKGLALSHVTGALSTTEAWGHSGDVTEVARGANLGTTGWADNTSYLFDLVFTSSLIEVYVNGNLEISAAASALGLSSFNDGAFGFYNFSQSNVLYAGITEEQLSPVPVPAAAWLFGSALVGFAGFRKLKKKAA
ncbi:hypothetical protein [Amphritea sp.]|uniref:hypothetical protein n=1 Tax=Amphritea sp. TaxID=1872502 RepID=UPI0025BE7FC5|nr:hypothetical protein [Amphritea sp.]